MLKVVNVSFIFRKGDHLLACGNFGDKKKLVHVTAPTPSSRVCDSVIVILWLRLLYSLTSKSKYIVTF